MPEAGGRTEPFMAAPSMNATRVHRWAAALLSKAPQKIFKIILNDRSAFDYACMHILRAEQHTL